MIENKLKPCPFCGTPEPYYVKLTEASHIENEKVIWEIRCSSAFCETIVRETNNDDVRDCWNARAKI